MNNAQYFKTKDALVAAFWRFWERRGCEKRNATIEHALEFARLPAMTTLDWNIDDVVQYVDEGTDRNGHYATITDFDDNAYALDVGEDAKCVRLLRIKFSDDPAEWKVSTDHIRKPNFPPGLVKLVAASLGKGTCPIDMSKCPLKNEGACMK